MRLIKIQHPMIFPDGAWRYIANEMEEGKVNDELIYYYAPNYIDLDGLHVGDTILLDERFVVVEVEK
jgi:hypothetical protein